MIIYPAIDIRDGKAVRLVEGDYDRETVFDSDPLDAALRWQDHGAEWIHIVDLDGARDGVRANASVIERIRARVSCSIQLGGGLRSLADLAEVTALGIDRMVIGSAAVTNPELVREAVHAYGERIAVGLDARDGMLATHGWQSQSEVSAIEAGIRFADMGVQHIVFTDIGRDGRLEGPNVDALVHINNEVRASIIASGGVASLADIGAIRDAGAAGVIVGAALYHNKFTLADAIAASRGEQP